LLNGADYGYNPLGVNGNIRIALDPEYPENLKPGRFYGQRA